MSQLFEELKLDQNIIKAIHDMGFEKPTKVQELCIPKILNHQDLIVMSKTGSGKTGAFGIPILSNVDDASLKPQVLILSPTRELAVQVNHEMQLMAKYASAKTTVLYGQHSMEKELQILKEGVQIITGTPGRINDHIRRKTLDTSSINYLVLDEADRMLDMGFYEQIIEIIKALPKERVTLLFSATMPFEIQDIALSYMKNPERIELESDTKTVDAIQQLYHRIMPNEKRMQLARILRAEQADSAIVFCNTRSETDRVSKYLENKGFVTASLHGAITQNKRLKVIDQLKKGKLQVLVATDVAARGIDVDDLGLVINYDLPVERDTYIHRVGRTGRAGKEGRAISMVTVNDIMSLYEIEEHVGVLIEEVPLPTDEFIKEQMEGAKGKWAYTNKYKDKRERPRHSDKSPADHKKEHRTERKKTEPHRTKRRGESHVSAMSETSAKHKNSVTKRAQDRKHTEKESSVSSVSPANSGQRRKPENVKVRVQVVYKNKKGTEQDVKPSQPVQEKVVKKSIWQRLKTYLQRTH